MAIYILVSGAWHAGWCWERVVPLLEAAGHQALAPDLLGMGPDTTPLSELSLAAWADQIAAIVATQPVPVILVGHSRGGIIISEVAERIPANIGMLAYLTAFLVPSGETLVATSAKVPGEDAADFLIYNPDGTCTVRPDVVGSRFYNMTEPKWVSRACSSLTPEPIVVLTTPLNLTVERFGSVPRAYIECTFDNAVSLDLQRDMQRVLACDPVFTLETDHSPFYSNPAELVRCLDALARDRGVVSD